MTNKIESNKADTVLVNGRFATLDARDTFQSAVAIKNGRFVAVGDERNIMSYRNAETQVIDVGGRTVIPGLIDSHNHFTREGRNYNLELRWDGVRSLSEGLAMLREQVKRTPPPQWVRVVGGWSEYQFSERIMPTLEEINAISPTTPVFVMHLYHCALLNRAAIQAVGYDKATPNPTAGEIQRDKDGNPTGWLVSRPNASILYSTHAKGPKLSYDDQVNSTLQFMREMNRFGVTGAIDAGGGFQFYPEDYVVITELARQKRLTVRVAYNLFTQRPNHELEDYTNWIKVTKVGSIDEFLRVNGAGEMLVYSAADFEDFPEPRPDLPKQMESELKTVVTLLARNNWPFRLHATYGESIERFLNVFEEVNDEVPINKLRWFLDHAETISDRDIKRVSELGGGIAIQDRMAYQGESFIARYGEDAAEGSPPIRKMLDAGIPVGAGTDATRVASYNPWISLYWLVTGKTVGGTTLYSEKNRFDRSEALKLYTTGSAWFSNEENLKGSIEVGKFADLAVLSADYFSVPEDQIKEIESVLTIVGGKVGYGAGEFERLAPPLPVSPAWSPVAKFGGFTHHGC
jgi:hypothetical protein